MANFTNLISDLDARAQTLIANAEAQDLVYIAKMVEAARGTALLAEVVQEGEAQIAAIQAAANAATNLQQGNNLSDVADANASLANLGIVSTTPSDGQVLTYDSVAAAYVNRDASGGAGVEAQSVDAVTQVNTYSNYADTNTVGVFTQLNEYQFGTSNMQTNGTRLAYVSTPVRVNDSGVLDAGTTVVSLNSSGSAASTTIAGEVAPGITGLAGRIHWASAYSIVTGIASFTDTNTAYNNFQQDPNGDYNASGNAHPQAGEISGTGSYPSSFYMTYVGYPGNARIVSYPVNLASTSVSVSNNQYYDPNSDTSTTTNPRIDYHYTDMTSTSGVMAQGMQHLAVHRRGGTYYYHLVKNATTVSTERQAPTQNRNFIDALILDSGHVYVIDNQSGVADVWDTASGFTYLGTSFCPMFLRNVGSHGKNAHRRYGNNLFGVCQATGTYTLYSLSLNTATMDTSFEKVASIGVPSISTAPSLSDKVCLAGANRNLLVHSPAPGTVLSYDISSVDLSSY